MFSLNSRAMLGNIQASVEDARGKVRPAPQRRPKLKSMPRLVMVKGRGREDGPGARSEQNDSFSRGA